MSSYVVSDTSLTAVADAIRAKSGGTDELVFPGGFVSEIGKTYNVNDVATGISGDIVITATNIRRYGFAADSKLKSVVADNVTNLSNGNGVMMFYACTNLISLRMANLTSIGNSKDFCNGCSSLTSIYLPSIWDLGDGAFANCTSLTTVALPSASGSYRGFMGCTKLQTVDYGGMEHQTAINLQNFTNCTKLSTLILRYENKTNLSNINAFTNTPYASGGTGGVIYIPKVLYDELGTGSKLDYKAATNWSTLDGYGTVTWATIEGSQYETQYADGTPIT